MERSLLTITFANGTVYTYAGEHDACVAFGERFAPAATGITPASSSERETHKHRARSNAIGVREMRAAFKRAEPRNDAERVGVIVAVAHEHKQTPVDIAFLRDWFERLGLREPSAMSSTVANARKAGLVSSIAYGQFAPTDQARVLIGESASNVVQMPRRAG